MRLSGLLSRTRVKVAVVAAAALGALALSVLPAHAAPIRYEAENATISQGTVATNHGGFSGSGFVDMTNVAGSYVEWTVNAAAKGIGVLAFRYANGTDTNRPMDIRVNGAVVAAGRAFTGTGSWDTWATSTLLVPLLAGTNTIRATATTASGGPNLDYEWIAPDQSIHIAKAILQDLAANGYQIVKKDPGG